MFVFALVLIFFVVFPGGRGPLDNTSIGFLPKPDIIACQQTHILKQ